MTQNKQLPHHTNEWKGYDIDELRYVRAYTAARLELNRERVTTRLENIRKNGLKPGVPKNVFGKVLGAFSYIDIALLAWRAGRRVFSVTRAFRRR